jgi:SAM-dependent methyltransferase
MGRKAAATHPLKEDEMKNLSIGCLLVIFLLTGCSGAATANSYQVALAGTDTSSPDVPFVPTPESVVQRMLELAEVGKQDMVYDLGCGDGRIVIAAARDRGARGVCVDISSTRIRESRSNAQQANVADRLEFLEQDLFATDLSQASVVTLYLLPSVNLRLRPKLFNELQPGTRVVSHAFDMAEWEPDEADKVEGRDVFFWVIPANVSGTWEWTPANGPADGTHRLELKQNFQKVEGTLVAAGEARPIEDAELKGDRLKFTVEQHVNGSYEKVRYEARVQGEQMQGRRIDENGNGGQSAWQAQRNPDTMTPLDGRQHFGAR